jgi:hypothetical protein
MSGRGHLFVIDGDLTRIACDAWLLPTDFRLSITKAWQDSLRPDDLGQPSSAGSTSRLLRSRAADGSPDDYVCRYVHSPKDGPAIFFGKIGGKGEAGIRRAIGEFFEMARPAALQRAASEGRRPLLALNAIATGRGGMKNRRAAALRALIERVDELLGEEFSDIDVVLVCWGPVAESAAQNIRRELMMEDLKSDPRWQFERQYHRRIHREAAKLANFLRSGDVSVFMGAGVSAGAGLKDWNSLLEEIGKQTAPVTTRDELTSLHDNRDAAALLEKRLRKVDKNLESVLRSKLRGSRFSLQHGILASLPCNEFITTNVDSLFELAAQQPESPRLKLMPSNEGIRSGDRWLLKLHGSVNRPGTMVFTREHYIDSFKSNRALVGLVQSMLLTRHMLFVGYGLRDEDFHELVHEVNAARGQHKGRRAMGTVLALFDDRTRSDLWQQTVDIMPMRSASSRDGGPVEFQAAVRDLERFLDLLGMLSADSTRVTLHPAYRDGQPKDLKRLADHLQPLISELSRTNSDTNGPAWDVMRQALMQLGADVGRGQASGSMQ